MAMELPVFRVRLVEADGRHGFLFEKRTGGARTCMYFFSEENGLEPGPAVKHCCRGNVRPLKAQVDQDRILKELEAYTRASHRTGRMREPRPSVEAWRHRRGYASVLGEAFRRGDPTLCAFLGGIHRFRKCILDDQRGGKTVIGRAHEFRVVPPESVFPEDRFKYLRAIADLLEFQTTETAVWFRPRGPVWTDFESGVVCRLAGPLDNVKQSLAGNKVVLLVGNAATGKTVLVRHLAYELHGCDGTPVYYFRYRPFDPGALLGEIRDAVGLVILEDVHLNPAGFQEVLARIRPEWATRVLFTSRPSLWERCHPDWKPFDEIPWLELMPCAHCDEIISEYAASQHKQVLTWSNDVRTAIKKVAGNSLWFLAYALQGYANLGDSSDPMAWIRSGVQQCLRDLEAPEDALTASFPEVLIALSPLYRNEVPTAERYLVRNLGFDPGALNRLTAMAEIARFQEEGHVFYRLPHSAHAEAYWKHGRAYRDRKGLPEYEDFLYEYLAADTPNRFQVAFSLDDDIRDRLLLRLRDDGVLLQILDQEGSMGMVAKWLCINPYVDEELVRFIAKKVLEYDDPHACGRCIRAVYRHAPAQSSALWDTLCKKDFAVRLGRSSDIGGVGTAVGSLLQVDPAAASELCDEFRVNELVDGLAQVRSGFDSFWCVLWIARANHDVGRELSRSFGSERLRLHMAEACGDRDLLLEPVESLLATYWGHVQGGLVEAEPEEVSPVEFIRDTLTNAHAVPCRFPRAFAPWDRDLRQLGDLGAVRTVYKRSKRFLRRWWRDVIAPLADGQYQPGGAVRLIPRGKAWTILHMDDTACPNEDELWWSLNG